MDRPPTRREMADLFQSREWAYLRELWSQAAFQTREGLVVSSDPSGQAWDLGCLRGRLNTLGHLCSEGFEKDVISRLPASGE